MEVYKITNKRTGQVYIGSTIYTKEHRWSNGKSGHKDFIQWGYTDTKFHKEVVENNDLNNLVLETVEEVPSTCSEYDLRLIEEYWINYYWNKLGPDLMYNSSKIAWGTDCSHMNTPEIQKVATENRVKVVTDRYGDAMGMCHTKEVYDKLRSLNGGVLPYNTPKVMQERRNKYNGDIMGMCHTESSRRNRSIKLNYKGDTYYGYRELVDKLTSEGYDLNYKQVNNLVKNNFFSEENTLKYPELIGAIHIVSSPYAERR